MQIILRMASCLATSGFQSYSLNMHLFLGRVVQARFGLEQLLSAASGIHSDWLQVLPV